MTEPGRLREKLRTNVRTLGERYFVDPTEERVAGDTVEHWKLVVGAFTHLSKANVLLVGEPGTGKTTFANVVASALSGLPFDLFARTQIQGHPDQTKEEMLSRVDVGRLTGAGEESVVWQNTLYLPQILIDEFNRLPEGKQSIAQEFIRTGSLAHLNEVFYRGDVPFAATVNEQDGGTYAITPPNLDRFDVSLEFTHGEGWLQPHVERAAANIERDLGMADETTAMLAYLRDPPSEDYRETLAYVDERREELRPRFEDLGLSPFSPNEADAFVDAVSEVAFDDDAGEYLDFVYDEFNLSSEGNHKRRSDDPTARSHDRDLAFGKVVNGMSARRYRAVRDFSRMLAFYLGAERVTVDHVRTVLPYCLSHTLEFTDDYRAEHATDRRERGEREAMHLTRTVLAEVAHHYRDVAEPIKLLNKVVAGEELSADERETVEDLLYGGPEPDHPHLRVWVEQARDAYRASPDASS